MHTIFVYGTLKNRETVSRLLDRSYTKRLYKGTLTDYLKVYGGMYPYAVPCNGNSIDGVLLTGISDAELALLDTYESLRSGLYQRIEVEILRSDGRTVNAWIYIAGARGMNYVRTALRSVLRRK